jgi:hypothetical protein
VANLNHFGGKVLGDDKKKSQQKKSTLEKTEEIAVGIGIYAETKEALLEFAKNGGDFSKAGEYPHWRKYAVGVMRRGYLCLSKNFV